ncbi:MAG TPA: glycosyltransferase [Solirubrobacterales bacterium]
MANAGSGKSAKPRKPRTKPRPSAAAEAERLAAQNEAVEDKAFALTHRVATLEGRERDLNELIIGHRERIAALEAERDALTRGLEGERQEAARLRERERDLQERIEAIHGQVARLEVQRDTLQRALTEEQASRSALEERQAELSSAREQLAALEAEGQALGKELKSQKEEVTDLRERERDVQGRMVSVHEQIGRLEARGDMLNRALGEERNHRSVVEDREAKLRQQLDTTGERERDLQETIEAMRGQVDRLESEREKLKQALTEERESLTTERDRLAAELDGAAAERERVGAELERATSERNRMAAKRDESQRERERLRARLEQLEGSRTYRMMRMTWRFRSRLRHPFKRTARPGLAKGRPAKLKKPAPAGLPRATPAGQDTPKLKPIPKPAMRPKVTKEAPTPETTVREPEKASVPEPQPETSPEPEPEREPAQGMAVDSERDRWLAKAQKPPADVGQLRVAGVLDEMSAACFSPDCDLLRFGSEAWQEALAEHDPHLLLVESTWQGNSGAWQYMVASYTHPDYIGLPNLKALIGWCRKRDIPTVFWNKEDPVHFERFKEAAALFDYVFTTDSNCIERYAELERNTAGPIGSLQFAAQPRIHNPIGGPAERSASPVFAGAYYRDRHIDRQRSLQMLLDAAMPFGLEIYDRRFGSEDQAFGFPERFKERVKGALSYDDMIDAYKNHRVFLNVNSVTDSPTMFSRRVFELLACGTAVVSTESLGVEQTLGQVVSMVETPEEATEALTKLQDEDHWRELMQRARRAVIGDHTYRHRLAEVASTLGFRVIAYPGEEVAALALVDDVEQARRFRAVVASISAQATRPAELLVGSHTSVAGDLQELPDAGSEIRVRVVQQDSQATRSQRYRELAALAVSPWLAILHPAHSYGEHHLTDLVLTTRFANADVIGNASYETIEGSGAVDRSLEHRFVDSVHPHSVLVKRELIARRGWPDEVRAAGDSLRDWFRDGVRIYSGDAGNFQADAALGLPGQAATAASEQSPGG